MASIIILNNVALRYIENDMSRIVRGDRMMYGSMGCRRMRGRAVTPAMTTTMLEMASSSQGAYEDQCQATQSQGPNV